VIVVEESNDIAPELISYASTRVLGCYRIWSHGAKTSNSGLASDNVLDDCLVVRSRSVIL